MTRDRPAVPTLAAFAYRSPDHAPFFWENGPHAILLIHGFPGTPAEMRRVGRVFVEEGWSAQGVLLPGFGVGFEALGDICCSDWQAAVDEAVSKLRRAYATLVVAGNSFGASLALVAAARQPVDGVILFAPFWRLDSWLDRFYPLAARILPRIRPFARADFSDPKFRTELMHFLSDIDLDDPLLQTQIRQLELPTRVLGQVRCAGRLGYTAAGRVAAPTLIFQGRNDPLVRPRRTQQLARRLPNLVSYVEVDGEHDLVRGAAPEWWQVEQTLRAFAAYIVAGSKH
ncbi:MAG: alpha/beta fold hydrolase [Caldilinea sp.]|nr:alpha/beta fold hydrolase [Caldilinea sp.]MDW8441151.1 alpha/beta fold hydrolase [Caldilineaceae bacterium]